MVVEHQLVILVKVLPSYLPVSFELTRSQSKEGTSHERGIPVLILSLKKH